MINPTNVDNFTASGDRINPESVTGIALVGNMMDINVLIHDGMDPLIAKSEYIDYCVHNDNGEDVLNIHFTLDPYYGEIYQIHHDRNDEEIDGCNASIIYRFKVIEASTIGQSKD